MKYNSLAIDNPEDLLFGAAPNPLTTQKGMVIGGGKVYPEINFTLPSLEVAEKTMPEVCRNYEEIITGVLKRARDLEVDGLIVEFETLPPMTEHPDWGMQIVEILLRGIDDAFEKDGLKSCLRVTPNDNREFIRPPLMRSGHHWERMLELFDRSASAGAELLSIESVGGKELHDDALVSGNLSTVIFSLCVLGVRDMEFLWSHLKTIADRHHVHCAGDTACGFGNTAMVLAEQRLIPRVFAAVVRAVTAVRSLVAYECGAVGPGKDCGYENPILKAITGFPMAMEGKTSACAHLSPMGNLAAATCDTWSNESVQNIKLLGGMAPTCYMEQLAYDCRLMNQARSEGTDATRTLQKWLVQSDAALDPQAFVISPESSIAIARSIVEQDTHYHAGKAAAATAIKLLKEAYENKQLKIADNETAWLDIMEETVEELPDSEEAFILEQMAMVDTDRFLPEEYGLPAIVKT